MIKAKLQAFENEGKKSFLATWKTPRGKSFTNYLYPEDIIQINGDQGIIDPKLWFQRGKERKERQALYKKFKGKPPAAKQTKPTKQGKTYKVYAGRDSNGQPIYKQKTAKLFSTE